MTDLVSPLFSGFSTSPSRRTRFYSQINGSSPASESDSDQPPPKRIAGASPQAIIPTAARPSTAEPGAAEKTVISKPSAPAMPHPSDYYRGEHDSGGCLQEPGSILHRNGKSFRGHWVNGRRHGPGTLKDPVQRMTVQGIWEDGRPPEVGTCIWKDQDGVSIFFTGSLEVRGPDDLRPLAGDITYPNGTRIPFNPRLVPFSASSACTISQPATASFASQPPVALPPAPPTSISGIHHRPTVARKASRSLGPISEKPIGRKWEEVAKDDPEFKNLKEEHVKRFAGEGARTPGKAYRCVQRSLNHEPATDLLWFGTLDASSPRGRGVFTFKGRVWTVRLTHASPRALHKALIEAILDDTSKTQFQKQYENVYKTQDFDLIKWPEDQPSQPLLGSAITSGEVAALQPLLNIPTMDVSAWTTSQPTAAPVSLPPPPPTSSSWIAYRPTVAREASRSLIPSRPKPRKHVWEVVAEDDPEFKNLKEEHVKRFAGERGRAPGKAYRCLRRSFDQKQATGLLWMGPLDQNSPRGKGVFTFKGRVWDVRLTQASPRGLHKALIEAILDDTSKTQFQKQYENVYNIQEFDLIKWPEDQPSQPLLGSAITSEETAALPPPLWIPTMDVSAWTTSQPTATPVAQPWPD